LIESVIANLQRCFFDFQKLLKLKKFIKNNELKQNPPENRRLLTPKTNDVLYKTSFIKISKKTHKPPNHSYNPSSPKRNKQMRNALGLIRAEEARPASLMQAFFFAF
jgi:hypothetical protein